MESSERLNRLSSAASAGRSTRHIRPARGAEGQTDDSGLVVDDAAAAGTPTSSRDRTRDNVYYVNYNAPAAQSAGRGIDPCCWSRRCTALHPPEPPGCSAASAPPASSSVSPIAGGAAGLRGERQFLVGRTLKRRRDLRHQAEVLSLGPAADFTSSPAAASAWKRASAVIGTRKATGNAPSRPTAPYRPMARATQPAVGTSAPAKPVSSAAPTSAAAATINETGSGFYLDLGVVISKDQHHTLSDPPAS